MDDRRDLAPGDILPIYGMYFGMWIDLERQLPGTKVTEIVFDTVRAIRKEYDLDDESRKMFDEVEQEVTEYCAKLMTDLVKRQEFENAMIELMDKLR